MMVKIKFCGITSVKDAKNAVIAGADAIGLVFFKDSPRYVPPEKASEIIAILPPFITPVGVFVNEDLGFIEDCIEDCGLSAVQFHGDEDVSYCLKFKSLKFKGVKLIKAIRVKDEESIRIIEDCPADAFLLDTYKKGMYGGTGEAFNYSLALLAKEYGRNLIISGGITSVNVRDIIKQVQPYAVDVSSGIESSPGKKNLELMEQFIKEANRP